MSEGISTSPGAPASSRQVLERCLDVLRDHLPPSWQVMSNVRDDGERTSDALVEIRSPDEVRIRLTVTVRRIVAGRDVAALVEQVEHSSGARSFGVPVVAAAYLPATVRERLRAAGIAYIDATGNIALESARPGLVIRARGADSDPWRGPGRPRSTLTGEPAARVVRALLDISGPWRIRELIDVSEASVGATYRVLDHLESEVLAVRERRGAISVPSWRRLLEAWSRDYDFFRAGTVSPYIAPRGIPELLRRITASDVSGYAVTGSLAVPPVARHASPRAAMIYVRDAAGAAAQWDLRPTESGQNVLLCEAPGAPATQRAWANLGHDLAPHADILLARPAQIAVDLMNGPGRAPEEARVLLDWMERHEDAWRT